LVSYLLFGFSIRFSGAAPEGNFVEQDECIGGDQQELQAGGQAAGSRLQAGEELAHPVQGDQGGDPAFLPQKNDPSFCFVCIGSEGVNLDTHACFGLWSPVVTENYHLGPWGS
jgi:hypothetical protein